MSLSVKKPTTYGQPTAEELQGQSEALDATSQQQAELMNKRQENRLDPGIGGSRSHQRAKARPQVSVSEPEVQEPTTQQATSAAQATISNGIPENPANRKMKFKG